MADSANNHKKFSVVHIELPFGSVDEYVCVPDEWVIRREQDQEVVVAYPKDEDRLVTRERARRQERYNDDWTFCIAEVVREFDDFDEADFWISTANDYGPLVSPNSSLNVTPSTSTMNKKFIDINEDNHTQQDQQSSEHLQDNRVSPSNFQPPMESIQSLATTSNYQEPHAHDSSSNRPSTSQHEPESIASELHKEMKKKQSAVEKKMRLEEITRKVATLLNTPPNPMNQNQPRRELRSFPTSRVSQFQYTGDRPVNSQETQHTAAINIERTHDANENPKAFLDNVVSVVSAPLNLPSSLQQHLSFAHQLDGQQNLLAPDQHMQQTTSGQKAEGPKSRKSTPLPQETIRRPRPLLAGVPLQANLYKNPRLQMVDHSNERNQFNFQNDIDRLPSPSDLGVAMDHGRISNYKIPAEAALVETTNNDNHSQSNSRFVSEQQMKDQFASVSAQMGSTLKYMIDEFEKLRTSILKTAASYQTLLENMEIFNTPENRANQPSTSRNVTQEFPLVAEEREIAATGNVNGDQGRNGVVNEGPERNPNSTSRLILPPEYDPDDTRWTLKHHEHRPGLVELMPHSNIYVHYGDWKYWEETSTDCPSLARRILLEVFSKKALSVCSSMTERGHDYSVYPDERPKLDEHACLVLLSYILEHGFERGWKTDMELILRGLHDKVREIRLRSGSA